MFWDFKSSDAALQSTFNTWADSASLSLWAKRCPKRPLTPSGCRVTFSRRSSGPLKAPPATFQNAVPSGAMKTFNPKRIHAKTAEPTFTFGVYMGNMEGNCLKNRAQREISVGYMKYILTLQLRILLWWNLIYR
ncbi:hypothetical protein XENORESO_012384 [Xenotaenia resolanae]|uniref:Uncharacterized protein n=1 Tax=Xenotaenia resolanae TaxID=208358 RepID=A0ABV0X9X7_9TELE